VNPGAAPQTARKTVTVVFADLTGSTGLGERLDPESLRRIMHRYFEEMRAAVERHGGTVEKFIGDAVMAVFGIPLVHEDDALRAVRAAAEMQERLAALNVDLAEEWGLRLDVRIGVNTGEVVAGDPAAAQAFVVGDAVNVAARLEQAAAPGQVLIGEATYRLVRDAVEVDDAEELQLKGKSDPAGVRRLRAVRPGAPGHVRRLDLPLVGRGPELASLKDAYERAAREGSCGLVTVVGAAGIGKSRLVGELLASLGGEAHVAQGRCLPYGEGITYWPVAEAVKKLAAITEGDDAAEASARLAELLAGEADAELVARKVAIAVGLDTGTVATEEAAWAVRRLFEAVARARPLVVVFDDVQWGEGTFLDLLEHVVDSARAPLLVVCVARPELADVRPGWGEGKANATSVRLESLPDDHCRLLVRRLLGEGELDDGARAQVVARAGGNPLFVEELLAMLLDDGFLKRENGHWSLAADLGALPIPGTVQALLAARLDRLSGSERRVIECAAVEGETFERAAVAALLEENDLTPALESLVRRELVVPAGAGSSSYRFRHLLIRDAAYAAIPKEVRAKLHRRFADWLERAGHRLAEHEEILGYHLEVAVRYHAELGRRRSDDVVETAARAARWLGSAGRKAAGRGDLAAAAKLLDRAARLLPEDDGRRAELQLELGWVLSQSGEFGAADAILAGVVEGAAARGERKLELRGLVQRMEIVNIVQPEGAAAETFKLADEVVPELEALGDDLGLAHAWRMVAYANNTICQYGATAAALERGLVHAERAGAAALRSDILSWLPTRLVRGPMPAALALERCRELLAESAGDRPAEAGGLAAIALIEAIRGRFDEARAAERASRAIKEELDLRFMLALGDIWRGELELLAGDVVTAEAAFRAAADFLGDRGDRNFYPTAAVGLARACFHQERYDEAWEALRAAEATTASDDFITVVWALGTRGRLQAQAGLLDEARQAAERGVELSFETDDLNLQADALVELAAVADAARVRTALEEAVAIAERKGNVVVAQQAREQLAGV
jgi:class 3 adenylate cyclase/tetratricopeptide (TPR) repeat protein